MWAFRCWQSATPCARCGSKYKFASGGRLLTAQKPRKRAGAAAPGPIEFVAAIRVKRAAVHRTLASDRQPSIPQNAALGHCENLFRSYRAKTAARCAVRSFLHAARGGQNKPVLERVRTCGAETNGGAASRSQRRVCARGTTARSCADVRKHLFWALRVRDRSPGSLWVLSPARKYPAGGK